MRTPRRSLAGFTLLEVLVALAVSGAVILGARAMLTQIAAGAHHVAESAARADREANAELLLRTLVGRLEIGTEAARSFSGDEHMAQFTTWCDMPAGWQERCEATIVVQPSDTLPVAQVGARPLGQDIYPTLAVNSLTVRLSTGEAFVLRQGVQRGALRYLSDANAGGTWLESWAAGLTAPLALGVILDRDTLLVRIGERG